MCGTSVVVAPPQTMLSLCERKKSEERSQFVFSTIPEVLFLEFFFEPVSGTKVKYGRSTIQFFKRRFWFATVRFIYMKFEKDAFQCV